MDNNMEDESMNAPGVQDDTGIVQFQQEQVGRSIDVMFNMMDLAVLMDIYPPFPILSMGVMSPYEVAIQRSLEDGELSKDDTISLSVCGERYDAEVREIAGCSICLEDFSDEDEISTLKCGHIFHKECVVNWGKYRQDCPMCRAKVEYKTLDVEERVEFPGGISLSDVESVMENASVPRETAMSALVMTGGVLGAITYLCSGDQFPNPVYLNYGIPVVDESDEDMPDLVDVFDDLDILDDPYEDMPDLFVG
jgi:NACalpha-BTF3-like transcription factor